MGAVALMPVATTARVPARLVKQPRRDGRLAGARGCLRTDAAAPERRRHFDGLLAGIPAIHPALRKFDGEAA